MNRNKVLIPAETLFLALALGFSACGPQSS